MAYSINGCMDKDGEGLWFPNFGGICQQQLNGCMKNSAGAWLPILEGGIRACTDDKHGCMEIVGDAWQPKITYDEYDTLNELTTDCCCTCGNAVCDWDEYRAPSQIEITFSGILLCSDDSSSPMNGTWVLTHCLHDGGSCANEIYYSCSDDYGCCWSYDVSGITLYVILWANYSPPLLSIYVPGVVQNHFLYQQDFTCPPDSAADGPFANENEHGDCGPGILAYGGTATINWSP